MNPKPFFLTVIQRFTFFLAMAWSQAVFGQTAPLDFGDAPAPYPTKLAQDGARHVLSQIFLGKTIDAEPDGIPSVLANGDELNPANGVNDEDGVAFSSTVFKPGDTITLTITASASGLLDAWIDWDRNGSWLDRGDQIFVGKQLVRGVNTLTVQVPSTIVGGDSYARFRFSSKGGLLPTGLALDGEVEDYLVTLQTPAPLDFGDAPQNYPVLLAQDGARHVILKGFNLGQLIDAEKDGQPSALADGDDNNPATADDEDGVTFLTNPLVPGQAARIQVIVTGPANAAGVVQSHLDAWIDWNGNGSWNDSGDQIFTSQVVSPGTNILTITVPAGIASGDTFARFRLSLRGGLLPTGQAPDGEVEDYLVRVGSPPASLDFGDAPQNYPVVLAQDGARHVVLKGFSLGRLVDAENDGQPSALADGDDNNPSTADDEDGVTFLTDPLVPGQTAQLQVIVTGPANPAGVVQSRLDAWIDWNRNGSWNDTGDQIFTSQIVSPGTNFLSFAVPAGITAGDTFARFRLSLRGGLLPTGQAPDGEVEDYLVKVGQSQELLDFGDAPRTYPVLLSQDGARHHIVKGFNLGRLIDGEPDGQPNPLADGDDKNPPGAGNDEDGVRFITAPLQPGTEEEVEVVASAEGKLDAWIDYNLNSSWNDPGEQIFTSVPLAPGSNLLRFLVPRDALIGNTFARFRFSRAGGLKPTGEAPDGEVEDYMIAVVPPSDCVNRTHKGTDFWLTFPGNYAPDPANPVKISLCIAGPAGAAGRVTIPGLGFTNNFVIPASQTISVPLPKEAELHDANDLIEKKGIHVTANVEVAVYGLNRVQFSTDGYLGLPSDVIGRGYVIEGYANEFTGIPDLNGTQFGIVAPSDNTTVFILPKVTTGSHAAGVPFSFILNQGQTYQLRNTNDFNNDLSGTLVVADKAIAVFGGHQCANIPDSHSFFCDYIVEQLLPVERAGVYFVTMPLKTRNGDTFRMVAVRNSTVVSVNGVPVATLNIGQVHEEIIHGPSRITSNLPILVTQYSNSSDYDGVKNSDPFMVVVPNTSQFLNNYLVCTPNAGFPDNYLNVVAPNAVVGSLLLDGAAIPAASYVPIPGTLYSGAQVNVNPGAHSLSATLAFGVTAYGFAEYDSYGFPGGMFFGDTTPPQLICTNGDITVTVSQNVAGGPSCSVVVPDLRQGVTVTDNCGLPDRVIITQTPAPGTVVGPGRTEIILSTPDARGNIGYCIVTLNVVDPSPLQLFCPSDMLVNCNGAGGAKVQFSVTAKKQCDSNFQVTCDPPSGSFFPEGTNTVHCSATDSNGKVVVCNFNIIVRCGAVPTITVSPVTNGQLTLSWSAASVLETAARVGGPWTTVSNAVSPYSVQILKAAGGAFFRVR